MFSLVNVRSALDLTFIIRHKTEVKASQNMLTLNRNWSECLRQNASHTHIFTIIHSIAYLAHIYANNSTNILRNYCHIFVLLHSIIYYINHISIKHFALFPRKFCHFVFTKNICVFFLSSFSLSLYSW